jgi:pimeloyl-ACP methyl ester carboxylesterase
LALFAAACGPTASPSPSASPATSPPAASPSPPAAAQASPSDAQSPVDGEFLGDIELSDGRRLHMSCAGSGSPTVILDAGYGSTTNTWGQVFADTAELTHVCTYDRAGVGVSSEPDGLNTTGVIVADLRELVATAGIPTPYILVGHSIAGLHMRLIGGDPRGEIAAMLFVDTSVPGQPEAFLAALPPASPDDPEWLVEARATLAAGWPTADHGEPYDVPADLPLVEAVTSFGALPITVLTAGIQTIAPAGDPLGDELQAVWFDLHEALASMSTDARHDLVPGVDHFIQNGRPDVVVEAIRELIDRAGS